MSNIICLLLCAQTDTSNLGFSRKQILNFRSSRSRETGGNVCADRLVSQLTGKVATYTIPYGLAQLCRKHLLRISKFLNIIWLSPSSQWPCTLLLTKELTQPGPHIIIMGTTPYRNYSILNKMSWEVATPLTWNPSISYLIKKNFPATFLPGCVIKKLFLQHFYLAEVLSMSFFT